MTPITRYRRSVTARFLSLFVAGVLTFVVCAGALQYLALRSSADDNAKATATDLLGTVGFIVRQRPDLAGTPELQRMIERLGSDSPYGVEIWMADSEGRLIAEQYSRSYARRRAIARRVLDGDREASQFGHNGVQRTYIAAKVIRTARANGESALVGVTGIEMSVDVFRQKAVEAFLAYLGITLLVGAMVTVPLFYLMRGMFFEPLAKLAEATRHFGETGHAKPIRIRTGDEIEELATALNSTMAARRMVEEALIAERARAEEASHAKSDFLANMSHEIRTPMNGVIGMLDLALDTPLDALQRDYIETASASAETLLAIINDILDFSKIEAGKLDLERADFGLSEGLSDAVSALALKAHRQNLELSLDIDPDVPDALVGDVGRLRQVIVNLIGNAIKFTPAGEVVLHVGLTSKTAESVNLHFMVSDTGIGIPAEKQDLIFDAFAQGDGSTTREFGGTGLGLSISTQLVSMMGGRIWVESEPGVGSKFHFTARFGRSHSVKKEIVTPVVSLEGVRVLVVDDNETNRRILEAMLSRWGMQPTLAESGEEALALLREAVRAGESFQLLLVDAVMPEMDGFALVEHVRSQVPSGDMLIMMLSSAGQKQALERCRNLGVSLYLTKPVRKPQLLESITRALSGSEAQIQNRATQPVNANARRRSLRILLAEDNPINQRVALSLLERRGHSVTCASNGREVVEEFVAASFDLVLMDVQMPEMSGFDATAAIRQHETVSGGHVPIVALTARAMKGDREECLASGMDGYLSKPIRPGELYDALVAFCEGQEESSPVVSLQFPANDVMNADRLLDVSGYNMELLSDLADMFATESASMMQQIRNAIATDDNKTLESVAHTLKGSASTLSGMRVSALAAELELLARANEAESAPPLVTQLETELNALNSALNTFTLRKAV
jgi:signal transduction histidine kinase/CheY-like chemotaxis protein